jgi:hypothetical protein
MHKPGLAFQSSGRQILWCRLWGWIQGYLVSSSFVPARGRTLRQRGCNISNAMNMYVMIMQDLTTLC